MQNCTRPRISIDDETIRLLERLSLVDFSNAEGKLNLYCRVNMNQDDIKIVTWYDSSYMRYLYSSFQGVRRLEEAIAFAEPLQDVDTTNVEPLYTVLENETLCLREDINDINLPSREDILSTAVLTEEDYFVSPPGNIPLSVDKNKYQKL